MLDRRSMLALGLGAGALAAAAGPRPGLAAETAKGLRKSKRRAAGADGTAASLQARIDEAAAAGAGRLVLGPGRHPAGRLALPPGFLLAGTPGRTVLAYDGTGTLLSARGAHGIELRDLVVDGQSHALDSTLADALVSLADCRDVRIRGVTVTGSLLGGIALRAVSGSVTDCRIVHCGGTAIRSEDANGLEIAHNLIADIGNNGIQVVRSAPGEDGTLVTGNRIERVHARMGGLGQYGNGVNVFRAGSVVVSGNRIADCAWSAIRNNAGRNCQILGNSCERSGEVAIYAEFAADGAVIAGNLVDSAAMGVSIANFDEGRRLSVVQGNLVRNLFVRPQDPTPLGVGIGVEADAAVTGNVVEGAPSVGILIGWGRYQRDVAVTGNVVRLCGVGIGVSGVDGAGTALVAQNLIAQSALGAVRAMDHASPVGPELVAGGSDRHPNIVVSGCVAT